jgi:hypothetical protein
VVDLYTVPAGKLLVIEQVSARLAVVPGRKVLAVTLRNLNGGSPFASGDLTLLPVFTGLSEPRNLPRTDRWVVSQSVKYYVAAEDHVIADFTQDLFDSDAFIFCSFSGYLVDAP